MKKINSVGDYELRMVIGQDSQSTGKKQKQKSKQTKKKQAKLMGLYIVQNLPQSQREDEQCEEIANRMGNRVHEMGLMMGSID